MTYTKIREKPKKEENPKWSEINNCSKWKLKKKNYQRDKKQK